MTYYSVAAEISPRAAKALEIIKAGGKFRHMLERNSYTGRDQFEYRLQSAAGAIVKGFGLHAFHELHDRGMLRLDYSTSVSSYYGA